MYCACGCGEQTTGFASFVPGHAVRMRADLIRRHRRGDRIATAELYRRGWTVPEVQPAPTAFGFEAEFFGIAQYDAVGVLRDIGLSAEDDGYHHRTVDYWRVTEDGSVNAEGCELVSPILRIRDKGDIDNARKSVRALRLAGGEVDSSCGLHVHHNLRGKTVADVAETTAHWALFQPIINRVLPSSRHYANYATGMDNPGSWYRGLMDYDGGMNAVTQLRRPSASGHWGRYHAINLQAINDHGTLEYRQHSGTLNADKLEHWVRFTRAMHDVSRIGSWRTLVDVYGSASAVQSEWTVEGLCRYLRLPKLTREFYVQREADLYREPDDEGADSDNGFEHEYVNGETNDDGEIWCDSCGEWHYEE